MRSIPYQDIKKCLTVVGQEEGKTKWLFDPAPLNEGLNFWDYEYLDPMTVFTKRPIINFAVRQAAYMNGLKIIWKTWRKR